MGIVFVMDDLKIYYMKGRCMTVNVIKYIIGWLLK